MQQKIFYDAEAHEKMGLKDNDPSPQTEQMKEDDEACTGRNEELVQQQAAEITGITGSRQHEEQSSSFF